MVKWKWRTGHKPKLDTNINWYWTVCDQWFCQIYYLGNLKSFYILGIFQKVCPTHLKRSTNHFVLFLFPLFLIRKHSYSICCKLTVLWYVHAFGVDAKHKIFIFIFLFVAQQKVILLLADGVTRAITTRKWNGFVQVWRHFCLAGRGFEVCNLSSNFYSKSSWTTLFMDSPK